KLLPAFYHLFVEGLLPDGFAIVGYARSEMSDEDFREATRQALKQYARCDPGGEEWEEFHRRIAYVRGEFDSENAMERLRERLEEVDQTFRTGGGRLYYCATPPSAYPQIVARVAESRMEPNARI